MYNGEINIIYDIKGDDRDINIFGIIFVMNNRDKCKMIIDNKENEIAEKYYVNSNNNNNKLNIILKGINNVTSMNGMFRYCSSLSSLPDISKWDTNNVTNMNEMFYGCLNIIITKIIIKKFNINKI